MKKCRNEVIINFKHQTSNFTVTLMTKIPMVGIFFLMVSILLMSLQDGLMRRT